MTARIVRCITATILLCAATAAADSDADRPAPQNPPLADASAGASVAEGETRQVASNDVSSKLRTQYLMEKIARTNVTAPADDHDDDAAAVLAEAIRQLDATQLTPEDFLSTEPEPLPEPVLSQPDIADEVAAEPAITTEELRVLAPQLLAKLKEAPTDLVSDPVALGDTLYLAGNCAEALIFYGLAAKAELPEEDTAWVLLQTAHCQAVADPAAAAETYARFQAAYPDSPFSEVARVRNEMQQWYDINRPEELIRSVSQMIGAQAATPTAPAGEDPTTDGATTGENSPGETAAPAATEDTGRNATAD